MLYKTTNAVGGIKVNNGYEAESLEEKVSRVLSSNEPIDSSSPIIYTERKDGVEPQYDIRSDRQEIALNAMDVVSKSYRAKREERMRARTKEETKQDVTYVTE